MDRQILYWSHQGKLLNKCKTGRHVLTSQHTQLYWPLLSSRPGCVQWENTLQLTSLWQDVCILKCGCIQLFGQILSMDCNHPKCWQPWSASQHWTSLFFPVSQAEKEAVIQTIRQWDRELDRQSATVASRELEELKAELLSFSSKLHKPPAGWAPL